jgi:two-component system invasion response regulator UvrY
VVSPSISVLIVDDQAPFRLAARGVVRATPGFEVVGEVSSGEDAMNAVTLLEPALVLMDINMGGIDGMEATRRIVRATNTRVVLLSTYDAEDLPEDARTCGAIAYLHKEQFGPEELERVWREAESAERDPA